MKQPSEMNNAELNLAIAVLRYPEALKIGENSDGSIVIRGKRDIGMYGNSLYSEVDYTNNIADIFPIMIELEVSLLSCFDEWMGTVGNFSTPRYKHPFSKDPIRAICECVLLVLREKE